MFFLIQKTKNEIDKIEELIKMLNVADIDYDFVYSKNDIVYNEKNEKYIYDDSKLYCVLGSYSLTRAVFADRKEAVFSLHDYNFDDLIKIFGKDNFINHDAEVIYSKNIDWNNKEFLFIRPLEDTKAFNGGIYNAENFNYDGNVIVANIKKIHQEYRFFIVNKKIVSGSMYKMNGSLYTSSIIDDRIIHHVEKLIEKFDFPGYTIDVGINENNEIKIVELNCLNASGFYDINLYKLVDALLNYYDDYIIKNNKKFTI